MDVRQDKYQPGDSIEWDHDFIASHVAKFIYKHGDGPFVLTETSIENVTRREAWRDMGHTQLIHLDDSSMSGVWFKPIKR